MQFMDLLKEWLLLRENEPKWRCYPSEECQKEANTQLARMAVLEHEINKRMRGEL